MDFSSSVIAQEIDSLTLKVDELSDRMDSLIASSRVDKVVKPDTLIPVHLSLPSFDKFCTEYLKAHWKMHPGSASYNGFDKYDSLIDLPNAAARAKKAEFYHTWLDSLHLYRTELLLEDQRTDFYLLENELQKRLWSFEELREFEWQAVHGLAGRVDVLLNRDKDISEKARDIYELLAGIPSYFRAAKKDLVNPSLEHTQLALLRLESSFDIYEEKLPQFLLELEKDERPLSKMLVEKMPAKIDAVIQARQQYIDFLKNDVTVSLMGKTDRKSFRLGAEQYEKKFGLELNSSYTAGELFDIGLLNKAKIHEKMKALTQEMWPIYFNEELPFVNLEDIRLLISKISENHCSRQNYVDKIRSEIPALEAFVIEKDLITLDPDKPLLVRETPSYMRGIAGVSISAPGPYEKMRPTYYNVTPLDHYDAEEAESYLREYNDYILQILNIHEAVPGHYTQLVYANESPSLVKSIFGNSAMIEGWACYVERMMLEEGYGNNSPEMWLMYYKWNLRELCNLLIDVGVHTQNLSKEQVMDLLINDAFQESTEAEEKWKRVQYTSVQLCSYYTGLIEISELREDAQAALGDNFSLKEFHEELLSYGSAPIKHIRRLMGY